MDTISPPPIPQQRPAVPHQPKPHRIKTRTWLQMEAVECGAACLGIILEHCGLYVPLEELRATCGVSRDGTRASNMLKAARYYGLTAKAYRKDPTSLRALPLPFTVFWNQNHWLVVEGFGPQGVYLNDPALGRRTVSDAAFNQSFSGIVLVCEPSVDFRKGSTRPSFWASLQARSRGLRRPILFTALLGLLLMVPGLAAPFLLSAFVDRVLVSGERTLAPPLIMGLALLAVAQSLLTWLRQQALLRLERELALRTSSDFFWHLLRLPMEFFTRRYAGDISSRTALNERVAQLLAHDGANGVLSLIAALFYAGLMLYYDWRLALIGLGLASLNLAALAYITRQRMDTGQRLLLASSRLLSVSLAGLQMIETVKAGGREAALFARWAGYQAKWLKPQQEMGLSTQILAVAPPLLTGLSAAAILTVGSLQIIHGTLTLGALLAFQFLWLNFTQPLHQLVDLGRLGQEADGSMKRLDDITNCPAVPALGAALAPSLIEQRAEAARSTAQDQSLKLKGDLEMRHVAFGYSVLEPPLIEGFNLSLRPGRRIALVGRTGSGKSTIARLAAGLYAPWQGEVLLDGKPRDSYPTGAIANSVAVVDQDSCLFEGSFQDNITLWDSSIAAADMLQAAQDACVHEDIMERAGGYAGYVQEDGANVSGGQRQRLAIARALVSNPTILILDEATSALDPIIEQQINHNLRRRGCACLIIAHRTSASRDCDEILVLERGKLAQQGTPETLRQQAGPYADLVAEDSLSSQEIAKGLLEAGLRARHKSSFADTGTEARPHLPSGAQIERLIAACQLLCQHLDIPFEPLTTPLLIPPHATPLAEIARLSGFRIRQVALGENWWQQEHGPILVFTTQDNSPLAVLPLRGGHYEIVNPATGIRQRLTAKLAGELTATGWTFYRPLPIAALNFPTLLKFGAQDCLQDFRTLSLTGFLGGLLALAVPVATDSIFRSIVPTGRVDQLLEMALGLIIASLSAALLSVTGNVAMLRLQARMDATLQAAVWDRLLRVPPAFYRRYAAGDLADRALGIQAMRNLVVGTVMQSALASFFSLTSLGLLFFYNWRCGLAALGFVGLAALSSVAACRTELRYLRPAADLQGRLSSQSLEFISGLATIRSAGAEGRVFAPWANRLRQHRALAFNADSVANLLTALQTSWPLLGLAMLCWMALAATPALQPATFLAANVAFGQLLYACLTMSASARILTQAVPLADRARPILETPPEVAPGARNPGLLQGYIEIKNVCLRYEPSLSPVLNNVSLRIEPGEFIAVVGASGAGKSSLLRLLLGFEQPTSGAVLYDGQDLAELDVEAVRQQMGVVLQHGKLEPGTLFENITGSSTLSLQDAWVAARRAGLEEDIRQLPMGLQTLVVAGSATFSGGQQQRLLIARAIAQRPRILLLDEATSALDNATQSVVNHYLAELQATRLVIAHRLSTVMQADRIIVMAQGQIVQSGTFANLIQESGPFQELARHQR